MRKCVDIGSAARIARKVTFTPSDFLDDHIYKPHSIIHGSVCYYGRCSQCEEVTDHYWLSTHHWQLNNSPVWLRNHFATLQLTEHKYTQTLTYTRTHTEQSQVVVFLLCYLMLFFSTPQNRFVLSASVPSTYSCQGTRSEHPLITCHSFCKDCTRLPSLTLIHHVE